MSPISSRCKASTELAAHLCLAAISYRVTCIFFAATFLLVWRVEAQETSSQINDLVQQLQSQEAHVRYSAAAALGEIGPGAKEAVPALIPCSGINMQLFAASQQGP
jgi:hypothetical protein